MASKTAGARPTSTAETHFPAYGPIDAILGLYLFYALVEHTTPTIVTVLGDLLPDVPSSAVRTALALSIWFIVVLTVLDQVRRQLAALGLTSHTEVSRDSRHPGLFEGGRALGYGVLLLLGWLYVAFAWDTAFTAAADLVPVVAYQAVDAFDPAAFAVMVVFFVAYGLTTRALDRILIAGVRYALAEGPDEE